MKRLLTLWALVICALVSVGCEKDKDVNDNKKPPVEDQTPGDDNQTPGDGENVPSIELSLVEAKFSSVTFEVKTNVASECGYCIVREGFSAPHITDWFDQNCGDVDGSTKFTIEHLEDNSKYVLYAILRSKADGLLSEPATLKVTTPDDGIINPITILNATYDTINFQINISGSHIFQVVDAATLKELNVQTPEEYIKPQGIGIPASGPAEYAWTNGGVQDGYDMHVYPGMLHYIIAAKCDSNNVAEGEIFVKSITTPTRPEAKGNITVEITDIQPTSIKITTTPEPTISSYYVYVNEASWFEKNIADYGEPAIIEVIKVAPDRGLGWHLNGNNSQEWGGLLPGTNYIVAIVAEDNTGGVKLVQFPVTTSISDLPAPKVEATLTSHPETPHKSMNVNVYSKDAASASIVFLTGAEFDEIRNSSTGNDDLKIVRDNGTELTTEQVEYIRTSGLSIVMDNLWPDTQYVALVCVRNVDTTATIKELKATTHKLPAAPRVESKLFTSLLGEWEVSYSLIQSNLVEVSIYNQRVTIAQGVDDKSNKEYREQNRLVILDWPFNVFHDGTYEDIPFQSPSDLISSHTSWKDHPSLAYRDYGAKIFLEIANGDVVTVPTSLECPLYNWSADGLPMLFLGCEWIGSGEGVENPIAPRAFPVTISADGNTITIGACKSGAEYGYGTYRPSVFRKGAGFEPWAIATSDIVLKRVK